VPSATVNAERVSASRDIPGVGRLDFEQTERRREYWLLPDGGQRRIRLSSVTTVLEWIWPQSSLVNWYKREPNAAAISEQGIARGKEVHRFLETWFRDGILLRFSDFDEAHRPWIQGAARFILEHDPAPVEVERLVCHPELRYAGRLDLLADLHGQRTLLDFKTSRGGNVYAKAHVQTWAYALADFRCGGEPVERRVVVGFSDSGGFEIVESPDAEQLWQKGLEYLDAMKPFMRACGERV
jgi:hypothetical protein